MLCLDWGKVPFSASGSFLLDSYRELIRTSSLTVPLELERFIDFLCFMESNFLQRVPTLKIEKEPWTS
jgi:hypothetical protein